MKPKNLLLRPAYFIAFFTFACGLAPETGSQPVSDPLAQFWRTDGPVYTLAITNNVAYIGGDFTYTGPHNGAAGILGADFGEPQTGIPKITGTVRAAAPDGAGGWYVGGLFTTPVGGKPLKNLVHIQADSSIDPGFRPEPDATVRTLLLVPGALIVGGEFSQIASNQISYLAFLAPTTGATNGTRISVNSTVSALAQDGDTIYLGGTFSSVTTYSGSQPLYNARQRLAAVKPANGEILPWNPTCSGGYEGVRAIVVTGTTVYVGGDFTSCGTKPRNAIASLNKSDGTANTWNPNAQLAGGSPTVNGLALVGNTLYAGGDFTSIGARTRVRLAALQASGFGQADATWQADANDVVTFLLPAGNDLLVGGRFTVIGGTIDYGSGQPVQTGGTRRKGFARISSGAVQAWGPEVSSLIPPGAYYANATCWVIAQQADKYLLGGDFVSFGGLNRSRIAAINLTSGAATDWNPSADQTVRVIAIAPQGVYVGGNFTNIGGASRSRIALLKYATGLADDWNPGVQIGQFVSAIAVAPNSIFVGGSFTKIGGQDRYYLAEIERGTGAPTEWNPQPGGVVNVLFFWNGQVYVGGNFYGISGSSLQYLALLTTKTDTASQLVKSFNPQPDGQVRALALKNGALYVGGDFARISGQDRKSVAAIDPVTGRENYPLDAQLTGQSQLQTRTVLPLGQALYIGGNFRGAGGENRARIASIHKDFAVATGWDPGADGPIDALDRNETIIVIGGEFTRLGYRGANPGSSDGQSVPYLAAFSAQPSLQNLHRSSTGHYMFDIADGDGLGTSLNIQASDKISGAPWRTLQTLEILGLQDPFEDPEAPAPRSRFYRLERQP